VDRKALYLCLLDEMASEILHERNGIKRSLIVNDQ
jgi:hypothetical protein